MLKTQVYGISKEGENQKKYPQIYPHQTVAEVSGVGIGEIWGDNLKGDYFPRAEVLGDGSGTYGYKTFVTHGAVYYRHRRDTPSDQKGKVIDAYISPIERVIITTVINNDAMPEDVVIDVNSNGGKYGVSMGTSVTYDICSYCGHKSYNGVTDRCAHIPAFLRQFINGVKVYMINIHPVFNDISYTPIPADESGVVLAKVASLNMKRSDIEKKLDTEIPLLESSDLDLIPILSAILRNSKANTSKPAILSAISRMGVVLNPNEYAMFDGALPLSVPSANPFEVLPPEFALRSILRPLVFARAISGVKGINRAYPNTPQYTNYRNSLSLLIAHQLKAIIQNMFAARQVYSLLASIPKFAEVRNNVETISGLPLRYLLFSYNHTPSALIGNKIAEAFYPYELDQLLEGKDDNLADLNLIKNIF